MISEDDVNQQNAGMIYSAKQNYEEIQRLKLLLSVAFILSL